MTKKLIFARIATRNSIRRSFKKKQAKPQFTDITWMCFFLFNRLIFFVSVLAKKEKKRMRGQWSYIYLEKKIFSNINTRKSVFHAFVRSISKILSWENNEKKSFDVAAKKIKNWMRPYLVKVFPMKWKINLNVAAS